MGKSLVLKVLDKQNNLNKFSLLTFTLLAIPVFVFLLSSYVSAQVIIREKVEINPQSVILPDAPLSNHTIRVDIQWSPASLPGWIMYYDLNCDQNNYSSASSASSTTGSNTFSHTSLGYENYQIQFRFGSLDPNQPTITGTYQLYYDEQLIRSESFQAQKATYSSYAYFNTHYQSPVLTDYNFSIYASEVCPGSYEDIYITTSRNCNATAEINTELDSITLTIETGREFVSFNKNSQKKDTVTFMFNELGSIYLRQDSTYIGSTPLNINIKSDWTGIIKYQQLVINPQEQFQIRVPDQPRIVYSGGVGALMIEPYSASICPPYISENLRYTALIEKGSNRGLLYDYDTGNSGDILTNLTPQEDGEKYLDFITEGEILSQTDTVIVKVFTNDDNIDTTEAVIIIYPNEIDVEIIPPVISQGDTARVVLKKRGVNGLEVFAADKVFNVEIVQGLEYGLILDSLSNDTLTTFSNIPQGFKIIAKDSTGIDSTKIRIKVSTEESGFPVARMIRNKTKTNKNEVVDDNENKNNDDEIITPDWIIPGPILLEGFGDVVVKQDDCDEEIVVFENLEPQTLSQSAFEEVHSNIDWNWIDQNGTPKSTNVGDGCSYMPPNDPNELEFGKVYFMEIIGTEYEALDDMIVKACLDESDPENKKWRFNLSNIRIPIMNTLCLTEPKNRQWRDFGDGSNTTIFETYIGHCIEYDNVMESLLWQIAGGYLQESKGIPLKFAVYSSKAVQEHEDEHVRQLKRIITEKMNQKHFPEIRQFFTLLQSEYPCPEDAVNHNKNTFKTLLKSYLNGYNDLKTQLGNDPESGIPISERDADIAAHQTYVDIYNAIYDWVAPPQPEKQWYKNSAFDPQCYKYKRIEIEEGE